MKLICLLAITTFMQVLFPGGLFGLHPETRANQLQTFFPPLELEVDSLTLVATWLPPDHYFTQLDEDWSSGGFTANEWTFDPGQGNWQIDNSIGNPAPSARFKWTPELNNYSHALVSKQLNGLQMPNVQLEYDLNLDNFSTSTVEQFAVEVFDGTAWIEVANYTNTGGNIPWTTFQHDLTPLVNDVMFKIRFRAYGENSLSINWWSIDNIRVFTDINLAEEETLLGYYVYINDVIVIFTQETSYAFNPQNFVYGQTYTASVRAAYAAGLSEPMNYVFTSGFLYRPCNLQGVDINHAVLLTWEAPGTCEPGGTPISTAGYNIYRDGNLLITLDGLALTYTDSPLVAGTYTYEITALYPFGDTLVESLPEGPVEVVVAPGAGFVVGTITDSITSDSIAGVIVSAGIYTTYSMEDGSYWLVAPEGTYDLVFNKPGYALHVVEDFTIEWLQTHVVDVVLTPVESNIPFEEDWSSGNFETNNWTFEPDQGNWVINPDVGNPAPGAEFNYLPAASNYSYALVSQEFDARGITDDFFLQFDIQLSNYAATGTEKLRVDIWDGSQWIELIEFSNTSHLSWTRHFFDISPYVAGQFTKVRFVAYGQSTYNIDSWRIDNIRLDLAPAIELSTGIISVMLISYGGITIEPLTIFNNGSGLLNFEIAIEFLDNVTTEVNHTTTDVDIGLDPNPVPGGEPPTDLQENEVILHYDGPNNDAIGLTAGGTFYTAARFPSSMVGQYAGYELKSVDVYINNLPSNLVLMIWGAGTSTSPGALLHQQMVNPNAQSWNTIHLNGNVTLDGGDLWVGYEVTHSPGNYPAGVDGGPANPNGDWISLDGLAWEHLSGFGLNYNFNIRAKIHSTLPPWLSVEPVSGNVEAGSSKTVDVIITSSNLGPGSYWANLNISSNDPQQPMMTVFVVLDILNDVRRIMQNDWARLYPTPAIDHIYIDFSSAIKDFRIINQMGQVVVSRSAGGEKSFMVDVSQLPNGLYFLQADAKDGKVYSRKIMISR